ncbi:MAG: septal ring lytic transglycosylase RlpA family protein [Betaproteobacteria bacterium]|nr:septal ring lytic transglycosylase RlpA family protein [Betaproteobacteria bacterium]
MDRLGTDTLGARRIAPEGGAVIGDRRVPWGAGPTRTLVMACLAFLAGCAVAPAPARPPSPAHLQPPGIEGIASFYSNDFAGKLTASGERYDPHKLTAASRRFPLGTRVRVRNLANGRSVVVLINDRGPYLDGRLIDLSERAARRLGMLKRGLAKVLVRVIR